MSEPTTYTPPTTCQGDTHAWPGEASTEPTPCVCGEKTMTVTYVDSDPRPPEAGSTPNPMHVVEVETHEDGFTLATCDICGTLGGGPAAKRDAVEDMADRHRSDTLRVRTANLGGGGA